MICDTFADILRFAAMEGKGCAPHLFPIRSESHCERLRAFLALAPTLPNPGLGTTLDGKEFHVEISNDKYLCVSPSSSATLSVLALPPIPVLDRVYSFCGTGTVAELKDLIDSTKTFNVYDEETGGSPLLDTDTLINGEDYYVSAVNAAGGDSVIRSFTNVVIANPALTSNATSD